MLSLSRLSAFLCELLSINYLYQIYVININISIVFTRTSNYLNNYSNSLIK